MMSRTFSPEKFSPIFVVGNSRSGTTLMGRILGNHPEIFTFEELHFFEELWDPNSNSDDFTFEEGVQLVSRLLNIQRNGYLNQKKTEDFEEEAQKILTDCSDNISPSLVFKLFLNYEVKLHKKNLPCEQTPLNVLYIGNILQLYPNARIINMVREPRDVLLSQKKRWQRTFLANNVKKKEAIRYWINYHPITISKLWNTNIQAAETFNNDERVYFVKFEELLSNPEKIMKQVFLFINLNFEQSFLDVPQIGSSTDIDQSQKRGIDQNKSQKWLQGGLTNTEIFLCEKINHNLMNKYGYQLEKIVPNPLMLVLSLTTFPIKLSLALLLNLKRIKNLPETIKRRLGNPIKT